MSQGFGWRCRVLLFWLFWLLVCCCLWFSSNSPTYKLPTLLSHILIKNCLTSIYSKRSSLMTEFHTSVFYHFFSEIYAEYKIFTSYFLILTAIKHFLPLLCRLVYTFPNWWPGWLADQQINISDPITYSLFSINCMRFN